ncbi:hypothetical protein COV24_00275 [candidate division WWE3 bacterium CG10_big_fil_rev_8_21_14_0_10_32_10]|uniref:Uncharacterized protein n=1 Tax=candidate division WWE3 bacterium CG10_big_fil_rev_8_21_14_0_10_32_10 TaxID=1975090 RepID=A0A2H0RBI3_UNCKA|nr:MAG: hypothetical protein COV24_00275 [candidate division WWE3 bacterium CG10_big_fil_rev_8_21_14_0_10_32_10]
MITTKIPYNRKVGLNICNNFLKLIDKNNITYLDLVFKTNEREAIGRRILIIIFLLEEYSIEGIVGKLKCGKSTVSIIKKDLSLYKGSREDLLTFLAKVYYEQFGKRKTLQTGGSRTISGTKQLFGLGNHNSDDNKPVPMYRI